MRTDIEYTPTPQELNETFKSLSLSQQLQFEAIMKMAAALMMSVYQASQTEDKHNLINRKEN